MSEGVEAQHPGKERFTVERGVRNAGRSHRDLAIRKDAGLAKRRH